MNEPRRLGCGGSSGVIVGGAGVLNTDDNWTLRYRVWYTLIGLCAISAGIILAYGRIKGVI